MAVFEMMEKIALLISTSGIIITVILNFISTQRAITKRIMLENSFAMYNRIKEDISLYISKVHRCYYEAMAKDFKDLPFEKYESFVNNAGETAALGYKIMLNLNPSRDGDLIQLIEKYNEACLKRDIALYNNPALKWINLFDKSYAALQAIYKEVKRV
jgi:hypothetical protein